MTGSLAVIFRPPIVAGTPNVADVPLAGFVRTVSPGWSELDPPDSFVDEHDKVAIERRTTAAQRRDE
jgi:hypothetical protein